MISGTSCPDPACLAEHLRGRLPEPEEALLLVHLDTCEACQQTLESLAAGGEKLLRTARQVGQEPAAPEAGFQYVRHVLAEQGYLTEAETGPAAEAPLD